MQDLGSMFEIESINHLFEYFSIYLDDNAIEEKGIKYLTKAINLTNLQNFLICKESDIKVELKLVTRDANIYRRK